MVFVLDKSSSITTRHFRTQLNFVSDLINVFNVASDHTHISVVTFDTEPKIEFGLQQFYTKSEGESVSQRVQQFYTKSEGELSLIHI